MLYLAHFVYFWLCRYTDPSHHRYILTNLTVKRMFEIKLFTVMLKCNPLYPVSKNLLLSVLRRASFLCIIVLLL